MSQVADYLLMTDKGINILHDKHDCFLCRQDISWHLIDLILLTEHSAHEWYKDSSCLRLFTAHRLFQKGFRFLLIIMFHFKTPVVWVNMNELCFWPAARFSFECCRRLRLAMCPHVCQTNELVPDNSCCRNQDIPPQIDQTIECWLRRCITNIHFTPYHLSTY